MKALFVCYTLLLFIGSNAFVRGPTPEGLEDSVSVRPRACEPKPAPLAPRNYTYDSKLDDRVMWNWVLTHSLYRLIHSLTYFFIE